jgi:hypothetical protein
VLTACGDDESADGTDTTTDVTSDVATTEAAGSPTTDAPDTGTPSGDLASVCDDYATITGGLLGGQADPSTAGEVLDRFAANAPAEIADAAGTVRDGLTALFTSGDDSVFGDPAFTGALSEAGVHLFDTCEAAASADVVASDYAFAGLPEQIPSGRLALRFENTSANGEPHEMILVRRPDGDTTPAAEVAHLPMEELMGTYQMAGVVFADQPGVPNVAFVDLEAGSYVAICTIPVMGNESTTHAMAGMVADLEVTA